MYDSNLLATSYVTFSTEMNACYNDDGWLDQDLHHHDLLINGCMDFLEHRYPRIAPECVCSNHFHFEHK